MRDDGFTLGNHSYTHALLSKQSGQALKTEVAAADSLLKLVDSQRSNLFRFPYGAESSEGLQLIDQQQLQSVKWNIDSLD